MKTLINTINCILSLQVTYATNMEKISNFNDN